jgi:hypothetical protein
MEPEVKNILINRDNLVGINTKLKLTLLLLDVYGLKGAFNYVLYLLLRVPIKGCTVLLCYQVCM